MRTKDANRLSGQLINHIDLDKGPRPVDRTTHVTRDAVTGAAELFIPDDATATIATRPAKDGIVAAIDDRALYVIEGILPEGEAEPATARTHLIHLDEARDTVSVDSQFVRVWGSIVRHTVWRFEIGAFSFEIETKTNEDDETPEGERFAQRLAVAMGWSFGGDARALKVAA